MSDHIRDSEITDAIKRAEAAESEAAKMRDLFVTLLVIALTVGLCYIADLTTSRAAALDARDAAQVQSQLCFDGWRQCKREADAPKAIPLMLDPVRRIDR